MSGTRIGQVLDLIGIVVQSAGDTMTEYEALRCVRSLLRTYADHEAEQFRRALCEAVRTNIRLDVFEFYPANDWTKN